MAVQEAEGDRDGNCPNATNKGVASLCVLIAESLAFFFNGFETLPNSLLRRLRKKKEKVSHTDSSPCLCNQLYRVHGVGEVKKKQEEEKNEKKPVNKSKKINNKKCIAEGIRSSSCLNRDSNPRLDCYELLLSQSIAQ